MNDTGGGAAAATKGERQHAWEQVFLRLLSLDREKAYNLIFIIDKDGYPMGGVTNETKVEWWGKRTQAGG